MRVRQYLLVTVAAFAFVGIVTTTANAQSVVNDARFTLPFRATWAGTVLPVGDYTLSVSRISSGRDILYRLTFVGARKRTSILAVSRPSDPPVGESSMLVVAQSGKDYSIRALHLRSADLVLTFPVTKAERKSLAKGPEVTLRVPILMAAHSALAENMCGSSSRTLALESTSVLTCAR